MNSTQALVRDIARHQHPGMTVEEEAECVHRYQAGDIEAGKRLVSSKMKYIFGVAGKVPGARKYIAEVVSVGVITAMNALSSFDPGRGVYFSAYIKKSIEMNVRRELERWRNLVNVDKTLEMRRISAGIRLAAQECASEESKDGVEATHSKLAERLGVEDSVLAIYCNSSVPNRLDCEPPDGESFVDRISSNDAAPEDEIEERIRPSQVSEILDRLAVDLTEREAAIFDKMRQGERPNISALSAEMGVSRPSMDKARASMEAKIAQAIADGGAELVEEVRSLLE